MKKSLFFAAIAATVVASCAKQPVVTENDPLDDGTPVEVKFAAKAPKLQLVPTKSTGAVNNSWAGNDLYFYSFEKSVSDFETATPFINNVTAKAPTLGSTGEINVLNPESNEPFYYTAGKFYDFYAYHVDDAAVGEPVVAADGIYVPFVIDGSQDLMIAKADQAADIAAAGDVANTVTVDNAYSAFAARRGVQPNLTFKHQLTRFTFDVVAGSEAGSNINIDNVSIFSPCEGQLKIVGENRGLVNVSEDVVELKLHENTANGSQVLTPVKPNEYAEARNNPKTIGESLMVIPGNAEYRMIVSTSQDGVQTPIAPQEWSLNIANVADGIEGATAFEAGYSYKITIVIYGLEEVAISVTLEDWKDGGSSLIDPDLI